MKTDRTRNQRFARFYQSRRSLGLCTKCGQPTLMERCSACRAARAADRIARQERVIRFLAELRMVAGR
jgi:hypothetical protein